MKIYKFSKTSKQRLAGVHPRLVRVAERVLSYGIIDTTIPPHGGLRTELQQQELINRGVSWTTNSKHRKQEDGFGHAIDLIPYPVDWHDIERFLLLGSLMFRAAAEEGVILTWGGHWKNIKDYPHFQIERFVK